MSTHLSRRTPVRAALVACALVLTAGLTACGSSDSESDADTTTEPTGPAETSDSAEADELASTTELTAAPAPDSARCAVPSAESLRSQDTAFEGTVTSLGEGTATLSVTTWYAGTETEEVVVTTPSEAMTDLIGAVDFQEGGDYLVSAVDGQVSLCGLSAPTDDMLRSLYTEAFEG